MRRAALIFNPAAGRADADLAWLTALLADRFELSVFETSGGRDAGASARAALEDGAELLIAAGGDGTVSMVAGAVSGRGVPLGVLPLGTSNSVAAALGIPGDEAGAIETIASGRPRAIDTAIANGRTMLLHASLGFHAEAVGQTSRDEKHRLGPLAYVKHGLSKLSELTPFDVQIETEREVIRCRATNVTVANLAPTKTVLAQGPSAVDPRDGTVDVTIVAASGLAEAVATGLHLLESAVRGKPATRDNVGFLSASRVRITADPAQPILVDGEDAGSGELVVECRPRSVIVMLPPEADTSPRRAAAEEKLEGLPDLEVEPKP